MYYLPIQEAAKLIPLDFVDENYIIKIVKKGDMRYRNPRGKIYVAKADIIKERIKLYKKLSNIYIPVPEICRNTNLHRSTVWQRINYHKIQTIPWINPFSSEQRKNVSPHSVKAIKRTEAEELFADKGLRL